MSKFQIGDRVRRVIDYSAKGTVSAFNRVSTFPVGVKLDDEYLPGYIEGFYEEELELLNE